VRTEASRLRARLAEYYVAAGKDDGIVIEVPKGGYTPAFRFREAAAQPAVPETKTRRRTWLVPSMAAVAVAMIASVCAVHVRPLSGE